MKVFLSSPVAIFSSARLDGKYRADGERLDPELAIRSTSHRPVRLPSPLPSSIFSPPARPALTPAGGRAGGWGKNAALLTADRILSPSRLANLLLVASFGVAVAATTFYPCRLTRSRTPLTAYAHRRSAEALRGPTRLTLGFPWEIPGTVAAALTRLQRRLTPAHLRILIASGYLW